MKDFLADIDEKELQWHFVQASGPGGQNINKVATAVQLRFDVIHSTSLPEEVRHRLARIAGRRLTKDGVLIIDARRYRVQDKNRQEALTRLAELLKLASQKTKKRRKTKPTQASQQQRLAMKRRRSEIKRLRGDSPSLEETKQ